MLSLDQASTNTTLELAVPSDMDDILKNTVDEFASKVSKLSGGNLHVNITAYDNPLDELNSTSHISIVNDTDIIEDIPELQFLHLPFIFDSSDEYFSFLSGRDESSAISRVMANQYNASIVGIYIYQTAYLLTKNNFSDNLSIFKPTVALSGVMQNQMNDILGFMISPVSSRKQLMLHFSTDSDIENMEIYTTTPIDSIASESSSSIGLTEHRYTSHFLLMANNMNISLKDTLTIQQAYAETVHGHTVNRRNQWESYYIDLLKKHRLMVYTISDFAYARKLCTINYMVYHQDLKIEDFIWDEIKDMIIIS